MQNFLDRGLSRLVIILSVIMVTYHLLYTQVLLLGPIQHLNLHYMLALLMVFLDAMHKAEKPVSRWTAGALVLLSIYATGYVFLEFEDLQMLRAPVLLLSTQDMIVGTLLVLLGLEASRRAFGLVFPCVALCFIFYALFGHYLGGILAAPKLDIQDILVSFCMGLDNGIYGSSLAISANYIFLFVVFGSILGVTGASTFFNQVGYLAGRRMAGGPAISAVISSALMGSVTGSAMANVATTGSFTIPLMKKAGYRPYQAGAIEAAASTGGQIMPPIMGATAFVLAEMVQRPYADVMVAGFLPAVLYFYSVGVYAQLQAKKLRIDASNLKIDFNLRNFLWEAPVFVLPLVIITIILLLGYTPMFTIFWALIALLGLNILDIWRKGDWTLLRRIIPALVDGAVTGAKIGVTCAVLGPIISTMTKTMLGVKIPSVIALWCHGSVFIALVLTALVCILLGCGLPTLAAYLIVSLVGVPTLTNLGVDLFAAHMFVFVFAVFSCITPPIATSAVPAAGIAGAGYMRTALEASKVGCVGFLIPFLVVFCPDLLIVTAPDNWVIIIGYFLIAVTAVTLFGVFIVGYAARELSTPDRILAGSASAALIWTLFSFNIFIFGAGILCFILLIISQYHRIRGEVSNL